MGLRSSEPQYRRSSPKGTSLKFWRNRGGVALLGSGNLQYLSETVEDNLYMTKVTIDDLQEVAYATKKPKTDTDAKYRHRPMTNTRFRLVSKSTTLDDPERPIYALCFKTRASFGADHENLNEDKLRVYYQRRRCKVSYT